MQSFSSRFHSHLFSNWRRTVSSKFFDTQVLLVSTKEFVLTRHACCAHIRCNNYSLPLRPYLFRIGKIENPLCNAYGHPTQGTSHLILHCPATYSLRRLLVATLCHSTISGPGPGELLGLWGPHGFSQCLHRSEGVE